MLAQQKTKHAKLARRNAQGFTLIETVITIGIIVLIGAASFASFIQSRKLRELVIGGQNALSILQLAQSKSLAGENNSPWGVHLETSQLVIFQGPTYAGSTVTTAYPLSNSIEIANISLTGGGSEILFKKVTGTTDEAGSFNVRVKTAVSDTFPITVESSGKTYRTDTAPAPAGSRVIDARHRRFTLGWSIKTATTLTLTFSNPPNTDAVQNIIMAPNFDSGKTKFDWSGTVVIGGENQELRVHTDQLTDTNAILSVDRDCRKNTKKIKISIDAKDIATYEANCSTITVGSFGGTMSEE